MEANNYRSLQYAENRYNRRRTGRLSVAEIDTDAIAKMTKKNFYLFYPMAIGEPNTQSTTAEASNRK